MNSKYVSIGKIAMVLAAVFVVSSTAGYAANERVIPQDNDASYVIPQYIPRAAMPKTTGKVQFNDAPQDNDALYVLPRSAKPVPKKPAPRKAAPAAAPARAAAPTPAPAVVPQAQPALTPQQLQLYQQNQELQRRQYYDQNRYNNQYDTAPSNRDTKKKNTDYYPNYYY